MLKIDAESKALARLVRSQRRTGAHAVDFRRLVFSNPDAFFGEIGQELFVVATDLVLPTPSMLRLDMLALDKRGSAVAIVFQAGCDHSVLGRALACLALVVNWRLPDFLYRLTEERARLLGEFLEVAIWGPSSKINARQRLILVAETFDFELLAAVGILRDRYWVDIQCVRVSMLADHEGKGEYLVCSPIGRRKGWDCIPA